jgi:Mg2+-importing ATPase
MMTASTKSQSLSRADPLGITVAATRSVDEVLRGLNVTETGLSAGEAAHRLRLWGPNAVATHRARLVPVLWHQLRSPLLGLLVVAAIASYFVGERSDAVIIGVIVALSVGLGFVNEYRAEKAAEALHSQIRHRTVTLRDGQPWEVDVTELVPGDVVDLRWATSCRPISGCLRRLGSSAVSPC